jgi:hypothetical protein
MASVDPPIMYLVAPLRLSYARQRQVLLHSLGVRYVLHKTKHAQNHTLLLGVSKQNRQTNTFNSHRGPTKFVSPFEGVECFSEIQSLQRCEGRKFTCLMHGMAAHTIVVPSSMFKTTTRVFPRIGIKRAYLSMLRIEVDIEGINGYEGTNGWRALLLEDNRTIEVRSQSVSIKPADEPTSCHGRRDRSDDQSGVTTTTCPRYETFIGRTETHQSVTDLCGNLHQNSLSGGPNDVCTRCFGCKIPSGSVRPWAGENGLLIQFR